MINIMDASPHCEFCGEPSNLWLAVLEEDGADGCWCELCAGCLEVTEAIAIAPVVSFAQSMAE